ncbi:hypothetical protein EVAR_91415_1 [Eumeta japonica]|uniref:Uncharacterized protein n=1 Tax=Eumeta variegata TaxID=151549 RepID=A0A4C1XDH5_EUMVA|nr:hypothetical protein EVAR_91415_1 [Eumeta japonica]
MDELSVKGFLYADNQVIFASLACKLQEMSANRYNDNFYVCFMPTRHILRKFMKKSHVMVNLAAALTKYRREVTSSTVAFRSSHTARRRHDLVKVSAHGPPATERAHLTTSICSGKRIPSY